MVLLIAVGVSLYEFPNRFILVLNFSLGSLVHRRLCHREHIQQPLRGLGRHHISSTRCCSSMALLQPTPFLVVTITCIRQRQHRARWEKYVIVFKAPFGAQGVLSGHCCRDGKGLDHTKETMKTEIKLDIIMS